MEKKSVENKSENDKFEVCIGCGKRLNMLRSTPISNRKYYIVGAGQLCPYCYTAFGGTTAKKH